MSALQQELAGYLVMRRALGHKLERTEKLLGQFIAYLDSTGASLVTSEHAIAWATAPGRSRDWAALRMSAVRGFAGYLHTRDARHEVPPPDVLRSRPRPRTPFRYSAADLDALLAAAGTLSSPLRTATLRTLVGLLAATGMRVGEAIRADRDDLDSDAGVLLVRHGKFAKQRLLPLHPTTLKALEDYLAHPDRPERPDCRALLVSTAGTRLHYPDVHRTFKKLLTRAGLASQQPRPRIHDLRHTFAISTLLDCYHAGVDIDARMPVLSTYLGHVDPGSTYWYLTGSPELLALAQQRLQAGGRS